MIAQAEAVLTFVLAAGIGMLYVLAVVQVAAEVR